MPDLLILSGKNLVDFLYLSQKLRFRISHLLLERVYYYYYRLDGLPILLTHGASLARFRYK